MRWPTYEEELQWVKSKHLFPDGKRRRVSKYSCNDESNRETFDRRYL